jgi:hypothetical protein
MIISPSFPPIVQACSTLAALAYTTSTQLLLQQLAEPALGLPPGATLAWGPANRGSNHVFVVNGLHTDDLRPRVIVAIRGTVLEAESLFEDADLTLTALPWSPTRYPQARISQGICDAVQHIQAMVGGPASATLLSFLNTLPLNTEIVVTGHSQGGCLASVVSLWLSEALATPGRAIVPYTFAGESAGDANVTQAFNETFQSGVRFYNTLDVVPKAWNEADLATISDLYPANGPRCDVLWRGLLDVAKVRAVGKGFAQPQGGHALPGQVYDDHGLLQFADEIGSQHCSLYYMWLTGVSLSSVRIVNPCWSPPTAPSA